MIATIQDICSFCDIYFFKSHRSRTGYQSICEPLISIIMNTRINRHPFTTNFCNNPPRGAYHEFLPGSRIRERNCRISPCPPLTDLDSSIIFRTLFRFIQQSIQYARRQSIISAPGPRLRAAETGVAKYPQRAKPFLVTKFPS